MDQRERIHQLSDQGLTPYGIGRRLHLSTRYVQEVLSGGANDSGNYLCLRCDHVWRKTKPNPPWRCPKCKSMSWQTPRKRTGNYGKYNLSHQTKPVNPDPTPEEIKAHCAEILKASPRQPVGYSRPGWELPNVSCWDIPGEDD